MGVFEKIRRSFTIRKEMNNLRDRLVLEKRLFGTAGRAQTKELIEDKNEYIQENIKLASWLSGKQKEIITNSVIRRNLDFRDKLKLARILASIVYAENHQDAYGKKKTYLISNIWGISKTSIGSWQLNIRRATRLNLTDKEFIETLRQDELGITHVEEIVIRHIGLKKSPEHILFEYNYNINSSLIYPVQQMLNRVRAIIVADEVTREREIRELQKILGQEGKNAILKKVSEFKKIVNIEEAELNNWPKLSEDGISGANTKKAWHAFCKIIDQESYAENIEQSFLYVIPNTLEFKQERNFAYFIRKLRAAKVREAFNAFSNNVDVGKYVKEGMHAYKSLSGE